MRIFEGYQKGVDLGGWFSQCDHSEQRYDTFITEADFAVIKSWGCDHVRLPVDYELLEDEGGAPREAGYARLETAVGWARKNGLNMVLDLHKTAGFSFDPGEREAGFFAEAVRVAEARNVPLYCGEYGVIDNAAPEDALAWYKAIHAAFEKHGIGRAAWSYRQMDFGLSDPRMDGVRSELINYL